MKKFFLKPSLFLIVLNLFFTIQLSKAQTSTIPWTATGANTYTNPLVNNVGINTTTPLCKLHLINGSVLFNGTTGITPTSGVGSRMMWIPSKSAFRAGLTSLILGTGGDQWDDANIGVGSCAFNQNTKATGVNSSAFGNYCTASNVQSFASGYATIASGPNSFASGYGSQATGDKSCAVAWSNLASGLASFASGSGTTASGAYASSFGYHSLASGQTSFAVGTYTTASAFNSFVIGQYNLTGTYSATTWVATDPLFVIGNGTGTGALSSNALTVLKNGNVGIGTDLLSNTANYKLAVNGDVRVKKLVVETSWSDFVFEKKYMLRPLEEVENFIKQNGFLPEIPSAKEVEKGGADVGGLLKLQMQKIEELTLYVIDLNKKLSEQQKIIELLQKTSPVQIIDQK